MQKPLALVVDDEPAIRAIIAAILDQDGFQTVEAKDGVQGLELARQLEGGLDLLISDIVMPNMDGLSLAESVRAQFPALPIILISGFSNPRGEFEFVRKPFVPATLQAAVKKAIAPKLNTACSS